MKLSRSMVLRFDQVGKEHVYLVGGKNASLGEMIKRTKLPVPPGFAITSNAYWHFVRENKLDKLIAGELRRLSKKNIRSLRTAGRNIRKAIIRSRMPKDLEGEIYRMHGTLLKKARGKGYVAVRSSATAEDLADASFAGQQETFLNVERKDLISSVKKCFASLFTDRAISYRIDKGFDHMKVGLSVGIQLMINSEKSGVMFTINPDNGFRNVVVINASYGLGEMIVQGLVSPDEFTVFKPSLGILESRIGKKDVMMIHSGGKNVRRKVPPKSRSIFSIKDTQVRQLAEYALQIEKHYKRPMDIEWAIEKDRIYILQARPETVQSLKKNSIIENYVLEGVGDILVTGIAIGQKIGQGKVRVIKSKKDMEKFRKGEVLVTEMTDPDWEPLMKLAAAVITDKGGKTSHAAIVSRELGIPCIIDTYNGSSILRTGQLVTVDCSQKNGRVWAGNLKYRIDRRNIEKIPRTKTKIYVNVGVPDEAFRSSKLPVDGVGLVREEFIITSYIREHPLSLLEQGRSHFFVKRLAEAVAKIAAPFYPRPVILRFSDFKTNEYAGLKGGVKYEPLEKNPMIGWRGASRYIDPKYEKAFRLECKAIRKAREEMGLKNIHVMIPFCRTVEEAEKVMEILSSEDLKRSNDLKILMMAEIPSNVILADRFSKIFDGFSIGSNDLTQLTLGMDRDNTTLAREFDERNEAVKRSIKTLIRTAHKNKRFVGICGEAPSNYPDFARFLVRCGIDSISVNPDVAMKTKLMVRGIEKKR